MKTIEGSSRGRGSGYRGGRGSGRGRGRGDSRFASRFTDPRFLLSDRVNQRHKQRRSPHEALESAVRTDPRFAKHLHKQEEEEISTSEESTGVNSGEVSDVEVSQLHEEDLEEIDSQEAEALDDEVNAWAAEDVEYTEARHRLAVVHCDWDHVRAVDLYTILSHALPLGGQLKNVCIYMSDFGKKMIEHERVHGPDLWVKPGEDDVAVDGAWGEESATLAMEELPEEVSDEDIASETRSDGWQEDNANMMQDPGEDGELFSGGKYRKYEMDRMKYYYAIATFDSADTAAAVYNELDGMDIEASGVVLDLRFVEDEDTFENPISQADCIPARFKPAGSFHSAALTQTRFRISWDQDDVFRHHSVQDSFTGTSAEDDLAAYLAPPDSDDDDTAASRTGRTKAEEKLRIRRKYAALLQEIGGIPEEVEEEGQPEAGGENMDDSSSSDDDDALNRFSDVEVSSDASGEAVSVGSMDEMEATLDMEADSKAVCLQREARLRQKKKDGDLGSQAELKYKMRRKEMKKAKKEMMIQSRETEKETLAVQKDGEKQKLKALLGTDDNGAIHLSGRERRKEHAKKVKFRLAEERTAKKQMRMASQLGVTREANASREEKEAAAAAETIDARFQSKLLSDPRFHLEVAHKDKRVSDDVVQLAASVAKARRGKHNRNDTAPAHGGGREVDTAVDYFLSTPAKKKQRRA